MPSFWWTGLVFEMVNCVLPCYLSEPSPRPIEQPCPWMDRPEQQLAGAEVRARLVSSATAGEHADTMLGGDHLIAYRNAWIRLVLRMSANRSASTTTTRSLALPRHRA